MATDQNPTTRSWRVDEAITNSEWVDVGTLLCDFQPRELALAVVRLRALLSAIAEETSDPSFKARAIQALGGGEFWGEIWWVPNGAGKVRNATPKECAEEIKRLREYERMYTDLCKMTTSNSTNVDSG
jgi:hypothetical protein